MRPFLLVVAALVTLPGCGGGGSGRLSAADYRQQADRICDRAQAKLKTVGSKVTSIADFRRVAKKAEPIADDFVGDLKELQPPQDLQSAHNRWIAVNDELLDDLHGAQQVETQQDLAQFVQKLSVANDRANTIAKNELGLTSCARS